MTDSHQIPSGNRWRRRLNGRGDDFSNTQVWAPAMSHHQHCMAGGVRQGPFAHRAHDPKIQQWVDLWHTSWGHEATTHQPSSARDSGQARGSTTEPQVEAMHRAIAHHSRYTSRVRLGPHPCPMFGDRHVAPCQHAWMTNILGVAFTRSWSTSTTVVAELWRRASALLRFWA